jgi:hypothetical protein
VSPECDREIRIETRMFSTRECNVLYLYDGLITRQRRKGTLSCSTA